MVSVCMATHNGEAYVKQQIESILCQMSDDDELIISDDGSTDKTLSIIQSIGDSRIKVLLFTQNVSLDRKKLRNFYYASANFINALQQAKGDYIFLSDQDDVWHKEKLKFCIDALQMADIVKHNYSVINKNGKIIKESIYNARNYKNLSFFKSLRYLPFRGCCLGFRRKVLEQSLPFPENCFQHDSWLGAVSFLYGFKFSFLDKDLLFHRIHEKNVSELEKPNSLAFKISYRLSLLRKLCIHKYKIKHIFKL